MAGTADWRSATAPIGIFGPATTIAHEIADKVRAVKKLFEFCWCKNGPWPWHWALVEIRHEELAGRLSR
jgi:hypothetical protein